MTRPQVLLLVIVAELLVGGWLLVRHQHRVTPPLPNLADADAVTAAEFRELTVSCDTPTAWANLGETYLATGYFPEAEACLRHARTLDPQDVAVAFKHGFALERIGLLDEANEAYRAAAERNYSRAKDCEYYIGRNHRRAEKLDAAAEAFAKVRSLPGARFELALLDARAGRAAEADAEAARLATEFATAYPPIAVRLRLAAVPAPQLADEFVRRPRPLPTPFDTDVDAVMNRANSVGHARLFRDAGRDLQADRVTDAEAKLREALAARWVPEVADKLADVAFARNRRDESLRLLGEVVDRGGPTVQSLWRRGQVEEAIGQTQQAVATWERAAALACGPAGRDLFQDLANVYERLGHKEKATASIARSHLAAGIEALDAGRLPEASDALEKATRADPQSAAAWFELAEVHRLSGRTADATAAYDRCLQLQPHHGRATRGRALVR